MPKLKTGNSKSGPLLAPDTTEEKFYRVSMRTYDRARLKALGAYVGGLRGEAGTSYLISGLLDGYEKQDPGFVEHLSGCNMEEIVKSLEHKGTGREESDEDDSAARGAAGGHR